MPGRELRIVPYNGNRAYKYYLNGYKVNGKRKAAEFYAAHLERESGSILVSDAIENYLGSKVRAGLSRRHLRDIRGRIGRFN